MTYITIGKIANSEGIKNRVSACAAREGAESVQMWVLNHIWSIAASPGWDQMWEVAEEAPPGDLNPDIGARSSVITDDMILAAVQPIVQASDAGV